MPIDQKLESNEFLSESDFVMNIEVSNNHSGGYKKVRPIFY